MKRRIDFGWGEIGVTFDKIVETHTGGYPTSWLRPYELTKLGDSPVKGPRSDANRSRD
jgi:hypothetical protein